MTRQEPYYSTEDEWEGRVGRITLLINAQDAQAAMSCAIQAAYSRHFSTQIFLRSRDLLPSSLLPSPSEFASLFPTGFGAWLVDVERLGHANLHGSEYESEYFISDLRLASPTPHAHPDACDEPEFWKAHSERCSLDSATASGRLERPRRPSI